MPSDIWEILHPRIVRHCKKLHLDEHYKHAALEAMTQVELALKEKSGVTHKYGVSLVKSVFGQGKSIKLWVPFGEEMQKQAEVLFSGAFSYYRNYAAHDGSRFNETTSFRVLVIASELLSLVGASQRSFADVGGIPGLIKEGIFSDAESVKRLLLRVNDKYFPDDMMDGLSEELPTEGYVIEQVYALIDVGLLEYVSEEYVPPIYEILDDPFQPSTIGTFKITALGKRLLDDTLA